MKLSLSGQSNDGGRTIRRRTIRRRTIPPDNSIRRGQFVARQFVPGQFVACIADRNIIKKEREREKLIKRERDVSCRDEDDFIEKTKRRKRKIQSKSEK